MIFKFIAIAATAIALVSCAPIPEDVNTFTHEPLSDGIFYDQFEGKTVQVEAQ
jgi:hypothetical protein